MRDVVKTNVKREQNSKRKSRRKRHTPLYFFMVVLIVTGLGTLLSLTLFFNVKNIDVKGDIDYTTDDVIKMSGISKGDNLIRIDSAKASQGILSSMIYVERADIEKQYPGTVVINVSRCVPTANIELKNGYLIVSEKGKILEKTDKKYEDLFVVKGFDATDDKLGSYLTSADEQKDDIVLEFLKKFAGNKKSKMALVDMSDKYDILVNYNEKINFKMGNSNDISYKLSLAETVLSKIGNKKSGTMTMAGANQISFRENQGESVKSESDKSENKKNNTSGKKPVKPSETTEAAEQDNSWDNDNNDNNGYDDYNYDYEYDYNDGNNDYNEYYEDDYNEDYYEEDGGEYYE